MTSALAVPFGVHDRVFAGGVGDLVRVGADVGEDLRVGDRAGLVGRVPADDHDAGVVGLLDQRLVVLDRRPSRG